MCSHAECTPEHQAFTNHLMGCRRCFAPATNYCETGWGLKLHADARFIVGLDDLADRRRLMARFAIEIPGRVEELQELVKWMYAEKRA